MAFNPNSLSTFYVVTALTLIMVLLLPLADYLLCRKFGLSLSDGLSVNRHADALLKYRKLILVMMFLLYLAGVGYVTFFSRSASEDYRIHALLLDDLAHSVEIDFGILDTFPNLFVKGYSDMMQHIHIISPDSIAQVYMNIMLFIPMGYLLPYVFDWFRRNISLRTISACILGTLLIENTQLITKMGFYDVDDLFANTLGGIIGQALFIAVAYVLTNPDWKSRLKKRRQWIRDNRHKPLFRFFRKMHVARTTVCCSDETAAYDFFVRDLGFYPKEEVREADGEKGVLLECGGTEIEVVFIDHPSETASDRITIAANNSEDIRERLEKDGFQPSEYMADRYTGLRTFHVEGPDGIKVVFIEE